MEERYQLFTTLIARCSREIKRIKSQQMSGMNLKSFYFSCLYYLYVNGKPMTATELCAVCEEDKAYVSRSIDALEKEGYVTCPAQPQRRYNRPIALTEKGTLVAKEVAERIESLVNRASEGISEENRRVFYETLGLIAGNLEKICENMEK